jgi:hypothetical protein
MNTRPRTRSPLAASLILLAAGTAAAQDDSPRPVERHGDQISVFSGDIRVGPGEVLHGSAVCIGGDVTIEGRVTRDVIVILGSLELRGEVGGSVTGVLSEFHMQEAEISGELVGVLTDLDLDDTRVRREMVNVLGALDLDELTRVAGEFVNIDLSRWAPILSAVLFWARVAHKFLVFVLLLLLAALIPERIRAIGEEAPLRYLPAFLVGLAGYLGLFVLTTLLSITLIGLPLALLAFWVFKWIGVAALFWAVGHRLGRAAGIDLSLLGSVLPVFALYALSSLAPSWLGLPGLALVLVLRVLFFFLFEVPAVGLVILTRVGGRGAPAAVRPASGDPSSVPA